VKDLQVGTFTDLGDTRALQQYHLVMQMGFSGQQAYQSYQQHPIHVALKEKLAEYLAASPSTYDYTKQL
ncbi:MAG: hypothetical protein AAGD05_11045, partial [Bacteroidota bacterium]